LLPHGAFRLPLMGVPGGAKHGRVWAAKTV